MRGKKWSLIFSGIVLLGSLFLADPAYHRAFGQVEARWGRGCPPNGYKVAQPALDFDLAVAGTNDSWDARLRLPNPAGGNYATTDAMGNTVLLPCIPDPAGPGLGADYYSPRFRANGGAREGTEVGRCVYECGWNVWTLNFTATGGVPDRFKKSKWESRDGDPDHTFAACRRKPKEITTFVTDLTQKKIAPVRQKETPGAEGGYAIVDAVIADLETPLSCIILDDEPIGYPDASPDGGTGQVPGNAGASVTNTLQEFDRAVQPGELIIVNGFIRNTDRVSHLYRFSLFGVNASLLDDLEPVLLSPGGSQSYQIRAIVQDVGSIGLFSLAFSEAQDRFDGSLDAVILQAQ